MVQHHLDRRVFLPVLGELRPVFRYGRLQLQLAPVNEDMRAERGGRLGAGKDNRHCILAPALAAVDISNTAPQIDKGLPIHAQADRSPLFPTLGKVAFEFVL